MFEINSEFGNESEFLKCKYILVGYILLSMILPLFELINYQFYNIRFAGQQVWQKFIETNTFVRLKQTTLSLVNNCVTYILEVFNKLKQPKRTTREDCVLFRDVWLVHQVQQ